MNDGRRIDATLKGENPTKAAPRRSSFEKDGIHEQERNQ